MSLKSNLLSDPAYQDTYEALHALTKERVTSQPFIPLIPDNYGEAGKARIMWCGAATNGWDQDKKPDVLDIHTANKENEVWARESLPDYYGRPFWNIQAACLNEIDLTVHDVVWNNIYKIGGLDNEKRGVPSDSLILAQRDLCLQAFEIEMMHLKPELVVLHVGGLIDLAWKEFAGPWADWTICKADKYQVAGHYIQKGVPMIWLSRAYNIRKVDYVSAFNLQLKALGFPLKTA